MSNGERTSNATRTLGVVALAGVLVSLNAQGSEKPFATPIEYRDMTFNELVGTYREAYIAAGFEFREMRTKHSAGPRENYEVELVFEFANPDMPYKQRALRTFIIRSSVQGDRTCAPCSLYGGTFIGTVRGYDASERNALVKAISDADYAANERIRKKLGKARNLK